MCVVCITLEGEKGQRGGSEGMERRCEAHLDGMCFLYRTVQNYGQRLFVQRAFRSFPRGLVGYRYGNQKLKRSAKIPR